jgi:hypothetical protein
MGRAIDQRDGSTMTSLNITHGVRDFDEWLTTFNSFDAFRAEGGVTACSVRHGVDDPNMVSVDLEFDTVEQARAFLGRLQTEIWPNRQHVSGTPTAHLLHGAAASG